MFRFLSGALILAILVAASCGLCTAPVTAAPRVPSYFLANASTANPAEGTRTMGAADIASCSVEVSANTHAVTVYTRLRKPGGGTTAWSEYVSLGGNATATIPHAFVIEFWFYEIKVSVVNAGADDVTIVCQMKRRG